MANVELIESGSPSVMQGAGIISSNLNQAANRMAEIASQRAQIQAQLKLEEKRAATEEKLLNLRSEKDAARQLQEQQFVMDENRKSQQAQQQAQERAQAFQKEVTEAANARQEKMMQKALEAQTKMAQLAHEQVIKGLDIRAEHSKEFEAAQREFDSAENQSAALTLAHKVATDKKVELGELLKTVWGEAQVARQKLGDAAQGAVGSAVTDTLFQTEEDQPGFFTKWGRAARGEAALKPEEGSGWENADNIPIVGASTYLLEKTGEGFAKTVMGVNPGGFVDTPSNNPRRLADEVARKAAQTIVGQVNGVKAAPEEVSQALRNVLRAGIEAKEAAESGKDTKALYATFAARAKEAKALIGSEALDGFLRGTEAVKSMAMTRNEADKQQKKLTAEEIAARRKAMATFGSVADVYAAVKNDTSYGLSVGSPGRTIEPAVVQFLDSWAKGSVDTMQFRKDLQEKLGLSLDQLETLVTRARNAGQAPEALQVQLDALKKHQDELSRFLKTKETSTVEAVMRGTSAANPMIQQMQATSDIYMNAAR